MAKSEWLAQQFEEQRAHLRAVAYRMLGSLSEADDAVQDAWLRASRADAAEIENVRGWLTTIVARVSLNVLRARRTHREESLGAHLPDPVVTAEGSVGPEEEALLADSVGLALLVVLDTLAPAERLAFVLHDIFKLPSDEIAPMVDRTPAAREGRQRRSTRQRSAASAAGRRCAFRGRAGGRFRQPHRCAGPQRGFARGLRQAPRPGPGNHYRPLLRRGAGGDRRALAECGSDPGPDQWFFRRGDHGRRAALLDDGFHRRGPQDCRDRRNRRLAAYRKARRRRTSMSGPHRRFVSWPAAAVTGATPVQMSNIWSEKVGGLMFGFTT